MNITAKELNHDHLEKLMTIERNQKIYHGVIRSLSVIQNEIRVLITTKDGQVLASSLRLELDTPITIQEGQ